MASPKTTLGLEAHKLRAERSTHSPWYPAAPHVATLRLVRDWLAMLLALASITLVFIYLWNLLPWSGMRLPAATWQVLDVVLPILFALWGGSTLTIWLMRLMHWHWIDDDISLHDCEKEVLARAMASQQASTSNLPQGPGWTIIRPIDNPHSWV